MKIELLFFGICTDLIGKNSLNYQMHENATVKILKEKLVSDFSNLSKIDEFAIAVNEDYATDELALKEGDIVAIIPPVSGG